MFGRKGKRENYKREVEKYEIKFRIERKIREKI